MPRDIVSIRRIAVFAYHGLYEEEARLGQRFEISLECRLDLAEAARSDDLNHGVSYADLIQLVQEIAVTERFNIIEALGGRIAEAVLSKHPKVLEVAVTVEKPHAAIAAIYESVAVTIHRSRSHS